MGLDLTSFEFAMKELYTDAAVRKLNYKDNPLHALLPKYENFVGENVPTPLLYGNPQARSALFSVAQSQAANANTKGVKFIVTRVKDYAFATVDGETMKASASDAGAFMTAASTEFDGALHSLTRSIAVAEYGDGSGVIGQVSAEPTEAASTVIQLSDPESVTNFEVGQTLNVWSALTGGTQRSVDGTVLNLVVTGVDRDLGKITIPSAYTASGTIAANDYLFSQGDRGAKMKGLAAWLPAVAPTAGDSFNGVDRSTDVTRLAGVRYDGTGMPIEDALVQGIRRAEREGAKISHIFVNFKRWSELEISLGSKVIYTEASSDVADVGFRGIRVQGSKNFVDVIADINCPDNVAYALQMDTWQLITLGTPTHFIEEDGNKVLRSNSADGIEARMRFMGNLRCFAPGLNCRIKLS